MVPSLAKRHSAVDEMFLKERPTASFMSRVSRPSLMGNGLIQRSSVVDEQTRYQESYNNIKKSILNNSHNNYSKKVSSQFNDKKLDTSSLLMVGPKEKDKSLGSRTSVHESKIMTRTKTRQKSKKMVNSITNDPPHHSNIINSKTSIGGGGGGGAGASQTTVQDHLIFFDQVTSFKNYFPESNVVQVLDIYDKKRRKMMFLNEMRKLNPENSGNIVMRKGTHILTPGFNYDDMKQQEDCLKQWNKYTFYPHNMQEKNLFRKINNRKSAAKKRILNESKLLKERKRSTFGGFMMMKSKKSGFFGEVINTNQPKKGFTDYVFEIIKDPRFAKWKKIKKGKRPSNFFKEK